MHHNATMMGDTIEMTFCVGRKGHQNIQTNTCDPHSSVAIMEPNGCKKEGSRDPKLWKPNELALSHRMETTDPHRLGTRGG